jgi:hypothetical protein
MKTFTVVERKPAYQVFVYEIEAENEEQAKMIARDKDVEVVEYDIEYETGEPSTFEIENEED